MAASTRDDGRAGTEDKVSLVCPIHGPVDGLSLSEGPLSNCWPWVLVCEKCEPHNTVVVGYESEDHDPTPNWEEIPE